MALSVFLLNFILLKFNDTVSITQIELFQKKERWFNALEPGAVDVVFLGSSKTNSGIDTKLFYELTGHRAFDFGFAKNFAPQSIFLLEHYKQKFIDKKIKYIFIEFDSLKSVPDLYTHEFFHYNFSLIYNLEIILFYLEDFNPNVLVKYFKAVFYKYTRRLRLAFQRQIYSQKGEVLVENRILNTLKEPSPKPNYKKIIERYQKNPVKYIPSFTLDKVKGRKPPTSFYQNYLKNLLKEFQQEGIEIIFYTMPPCDSKLGFWQHQKFFNEVKVPVLHLGRKEIYYRFFKEGLMKDKKHLNPNGAKLYTRLLSKRVNDLAILR